MGYIWILIYTVGVLIALGILSSAFLGVASSLIQETEDNAG